MLTESYYSNGKLLLSGEYVVLDGALSLAVPAKFGQLLSIEPIDETILRWKSLDEKGRVWYEEEFQLNRNKILKQQVDYNEIGNRIIQIINAVTELNPNFLNNANGFNITTSLTFPKNWGLGTSSTLINNIAEWTNIDAYALLEKTFGGSGYDIACAKNNAPITYELKHNKPIVNQVDFHPNFKEHLYFVYLNKKQNSREGIVNYRANENKSKSIITEISDLTTKMISCKFLDDFDELIIEHEQLISTIIKQKPVKAQLFSDFEGQIKSLGAWGGDFILATSENNPKHYFKSKGFETIIPYSQMVF